MLYRVSFSLNFSCLKKMDNKCGKNTTETIRNILVEIFEVQFILKVNFSCIF